MDEKLEIKEHVYIFVTSFSLTSVDIISELTTFCHNDAQYTQSYCTIVIQAGGYLYKIMGKTGKMISNRLLNMVNFFSFCRLAAIYTISWERG